MSDLRLAVKRKYFDQIKRGDKPDEYRERTEYWRKRLENRMYDTVTITLGYPKKGDTEREMVFKWNGYMEINIVHEFFQNKLKPVFAINLTERIR